MNYLKLNKDWNADPNVPEPIVYSKDGKLTVEFYLNYFVYDQFKEGDKGRISFNQCSRYHFGVTNDEGYFMGQYRVSNDDLPWGEFYQIIDGLNREFPSSIYVNENLRNDLNHYIFFFRDSTLEVEANDFLFDLMPID